MGHPHRIVCTACPEPKPNCFVFLGEMDIFLEEGADRDVAVLETRREIRNLLSENTDISGVQEVRYLAPEILDASAAEGGSTRNIDLGDDSGMDAGVSVLVGLGSFFLFVALVAGYRYRRKSGEKEIPMSVISGSQITGVDSASPTENAGPASPFSEMLPNPYKSGDNASMGAILEGESDSASHAMSSDIVVSDSGFTDDDSRDISMLQSLENESMLGATRMLPLDDEYLCDNDDILSIESSVKEASIVGPMP